MRASDTLTECLEKKRNKIGMTFTSTRKGLESRRKIKNKASVLVSIVLPVASVLRMARLLLQTVAVIMV